MWGSGKSKREEPPGRALPSGSFFDGAPEAVFVTSLDGLFQAANDRACALFGFDREDVPHQALVKVLAPSERLPDPAALFRRIELEGEVTADVEIYKHDGSRLGLELKGRRVDKETVAWIARDVTLQHRGEIQVRERERMLQALLQATEDCIFLVDFQLRVLFANPALAKLLKTAPQALVGRALTDIFHPDVASALAPVVKTAIESGKAQRVDTRLEYAPNAPMLAVHFSPVALGPGSPAAAVGIAREIAVRPPSEEMVRDTERTLRELLESASVMFIGFTPFGKAVLMNRAAERVTGYYRTEVLEKDLSRMLFGDETDHRIYLLKLQDISQGGVPGESFENEIQDKSGERKIIQWRMSPYRDRTHALTCVLAIGVDITQQKLLEAQETAQQELGTARSVLAGLAHDYNNLLNIVLGYTSLTLGKTEPGTGVHEAIRNIQQAGQRAVSLTQRLMELSRRAAPPKTILGVNPKIEAVATRLQKIFPSSVQIKLDLAPDAWTIESSPDEFETVLYNLCENARDAMPSQGILTLSTRNAEFDPVEAGKMPGAHPGRYVAVCVADTGVGIASENLPHIFEPFFSTKEQEGAGLGLSVAYGIIKNAGGWVTAQSHPGRGTRLTVYLPVTVKPLEEFEEPPGGSETILVVDDEEMILDLTQKMLEGFGYTVRTFRDGPATLDYFRDPKSPGDLVLLDYAMPGMNGLQAFGELWKVRPDVKVIMASGYPPDTAKALIRQGGIRRFLQKPFSRVGLGRAVRQVLDAK